ncbi:MAG: hypothetical protein ACHQYP_05710 [Nitrospiria bacterium]
MNYLFFRWPIIAFVFGTLAVILAGCIVSGGYGYDNGGGIGVDYYEPYGVYYGGWGPGYRVAPFRDGDRRLIREGGRGSAHAYRPAPASRSMPSLPSRSGSGGSRQIR